MSGFSTKIGKVFLRVAGGFILFAGLGAQTNTSPLSEIFFLDLGIVIEPVRGNESYSRLIKAPSKEITFRIKKVESGSVYMASSKEMLTALDRINQRIESLEQFFRVEMKGLKQENASLREILAQMKSPPQEKPERPQYLSQMDAPPELEDVVVLENLPPVLMPEPITLTPQKPKLEFDQSLYMSGVFAYQREDYRAALEKFGRLHLEIATRRTAENILYWMADALQQLGDYQAALTLLEKVTTDGDQRIDDALIQRGLLYRKLGQETLALAAFADVVNNYPESEYMRLAELELKRAEAMP